MDSNYNCIITFGRAFSANHPNLITISQFSTLTENHFSAQFLHTHSHHLSLHNHSLTILNLVLTIIFQLKQKIITEKITLSHSLLFSKFSTNPFAHFDKSYQVLWKFLCGLKNCRYCWASVDESWSKTATDSNCYEALNVHDSCWFLII